MITITCRTCGYRWKSMAVTECFVCRINEDEQELRSAIEALRHKKKWYIRVTRFHLWLTAILGPLIAILLIFLKSR